MAPAQGREGCMADSAATILQPVGLSPLSLPAAAPRCAAARPTQARVAIRCGWRPLARAGFQLLVAAAACLLACPSSRSAGASWVAPPVARRMIGAQDGRGPLALGRLRGFTEADGRAPEVALQARMGFHARDPSGVRHIETRKQAQKASLFKETLLDIFARREIVYRHMGDEEMQHRIRIDDVIFTKGCRAAYVHVGAIGDMLERRQAFVWLVRNKGAVKSALARRFKKLGTLPQIYFVESQMDKWHEQFNRARKYPEMNLPDPFAELEQKMSQERWKNWGVGDEQAPFPTRGFPERRR